MRALIVADDLTGALDSAVTLAAAGLAVVAARRPGDVAAALAERPDVLAVSTASREGGAAAAREAVAAALDAVGVLPEIVLKKVDSRLKGHVAVEVAATAARAGLARAVAAPGVPSQGRTVADGRLRGPGVAAPIDVAAALAGAGLEVEVPDTDGDGDFDAAVARALGGSPALLVGAAGLAAALGRRLGREGAAARPRVEAPILLAIGSRDPITLAQVARLEAAGRTAVLAPDGVCGAAPAGPVALVRLTAAEGRGFDPAAAGARFAEGIARMAERGGFATVLGCGGETADAILGALGVGVLRVEGEILPGVPVSAMLAGGRPMRLVTKSGGFGGEDALAQVVEAAVGPREAA
ncbi:four-carbon acid sugar kinase family protein [Amaricoccus sp.]|uniref:four-carbon acid sugar kinase family protein n=1 Tax=Amaricoccus sp. TaxID=1872485 RepID=UPI001B490312|nr:four-carbon acid sugar kinase family protein [Amaricoccus sp.]MBP7000284.1 hypothetical protein [Amaricoccus sp.]